MGKESRILAWMDMWQCGRALRCVQTRLCLARYLTDDAPSYIRHEQGQSVLAPMSLAPPCTVRHGGIPVLASMSSCLIEDREYSTVVMLALASFTLGRGPVQTGWNRFAPLGLVRKRQWWVASGRVSRPPATKNGTTINFGYLCKKALYPSAVFHSRPETHNDSEVVPPSPCRAFSTHGGKQCRKARLPAPVLGSPPSRIAVHARVPTYHPLARTETHGQDMAGQERKPVPAPQGAMTRPP